MPSSSAAESQEPTQAALSAAEEIMYEFALILNDPARTMKRRRLIASIIDRHINEEE